jgi:syntaxin 7
VQERNREIREIETAVVEVGQIFQDLAAMVNEQGVMVDNIESNISSSVEATSTGVEQLEGAEEYQRKARKKCVIITIIVVVIIAIIVLAILWGLHII